MRVPTFDLSGRPLMLFGARSAARSGSGRIELFRRDSRCRRGTFAERIGAGDANHV